MMSNRYRIRSVELFSRVYAPTAKLKTAKISFSNPHTNTLSITGDQHVAMHVEASNNAISSMRFYDGTSCNSSLLREH